VLALNHRLIPPSLHFETPNPAIDFENSPFYVNNRLSEWQANGNPLRAAVSSLGIGGTNAHVLLEEWSTAQSAESPCPPAKNRPHQLILLSAKTETALEQITQNLVDHLEKNPRINLEDTAYTLQIGRKALEYKKMLVCSDTGEVTRELSAPDTNRVKSFQAKLEKHSVIFMFSGLGAQYVNMGRELYESTPRVPQRDRPLPPNTQTTDKLRYKGNPLSFFYV
jgi:acyl transferase domain-containing protein